MIGEGSAALSATTAKATPVEDAADRRLDLLADELGRAGDDDVEAVELGDAGGRVVEADLDELDLERRALRDRGRGVSVSSLPCPSTSKWSRWTWPFASAGTRKNLRRAAASTSASRLRPGPASSARTRGWTATRNAWTREPLASPRSLRSISSAWVASDTTKPSPPHTAHFVVRISRGPSVTFWRVISTSPSGEISTT